MGNQRVVLGFPDGLPVELFEARDEVDELLDAQGVSGDIGFLLQLLAHSTRINLSVWAGEAQRMQDLLREMKVKLESETQRADEAESELEALKARRCGGCKHWHGHNYCAEGIAEECDVPELPDHDFACNRWTPKEADHEA